MFDGIVEYAQGGPAPDLVGLDEAGREFLASEHGRAEAAHWARKRAGVRSTSASVMGEQEVGLAEGLLARPLAMFITRMNTKGAQFARQRERLGDDF